MIRFRLYILTLLTIILSSCLSDNTDAENEVSLGIGDPIPEFSIMTTDGTSISRSGILDSGRNTLLCFFHTSCQDCQRQLPEVEKAYRMIEDPSQYIVVAISRAEDAASVSNYWTSHQMTLPVSPQTDRGIYNKFATSGIPRLFFISPDGIIRHTADAEHPLDATQIYELLKGNK